MPHRRFPSQNNHRMPHRRFPSQNNFEGRITSTWPDQFFLFCKLFLNVMLIISAKIYKLFSLSDVYLAIQCWQKNEKGWRRRLQKSTLKGFLHIFKTRYMLKSSKSCLITLLIVFKNLLSLLRYLSLKIS